jgi:hypothetical protein
MRTVTSCSRSSAQYKTKAHGKLSVGVTNSRIESAADVRSLVNVLEGPAIKHGDSRQTISFAAPAPRGGCRRRAGGRGAVCQHDPPGAGNWSNAYSGDPASLRARIVFAPPVVGQPALPRPIPEYSGLVTLAGQRGPGFMLPIRARLTQFRLTPRSGFPGAKSGYLSVEPRRTDNNLPITPHTIGSITLQ